VTGLIASAVTAAGNVVTGLMADLEGAVPQLVPVLPPSPTSGVGLVTVLTTSPFSAR